MTRLRTHLLLWLLLPLLLLWVLALKLQNVRSQGHSDAAHDRALLGSALVMAEQVVVQDGQLVAGIPLAALEMLESRAQDRVVYQVACLDRPAFVAGVDDLPVPARPGPDAPVFSDIVYNGMEMRLVTLQRPVFDVPTCSTLMVSVGETTLARDRLSDTILTEASAIQLLLIAAAAGLIVFGVRRGLLPLQRIRHGIQARDEQDLSAIDTRTAPREVVPLIDAINLQMERQRGISEAHRRFVADASHQLKTPLAVLKTQAELALQQRDPAQMRAHVQELHDATASTARVVNQLLALLRSDPLAQHGSETVDLGHAARDASFDLLPLALAKGVELDFDADDGVCIVGHAVLLHELVANLVDNAIRYTPAGGRIVIHVGRDAGGAAVLGVADTGPGIAASERERVFARFYRAPGTAGDGCGLGLAIVKQIADRYGAAVDLGDAEGGGLQVRVRFPPQPP